jgi:dGTPase
MTSPFTPLTITERERALLASYAMHSADTAGRQFFEETHAYRGPFQRDRDRITHSAAFRRLSYKTQVFTGGMGDYHRTRLTHTLEVASMARTLGRALRLNEDLIESLALAHDLGHPPFGHTGEAALNRCLAAEGGFNHNRHGLRILTVLERRGSPHPGLNLSREVLEGQQARAEKDATVGAGTLLEAQVVDAADSVAYDTHDADDALKLGLLTLDELLEIPLWQRAAERVRGQFAVLFPGEFRRAVLHELIDWQVGDLYAETTRGLAERGIATVADVKASPVLVRPNAELAQQKIELERFLFERVYRHPRVQEMRTRAQDMLREMFDWLVASPELMPESFRARIEEAGLARSVGDYLAGMTDRYAQEQHARLTGGGS